MQMYAQCTATWCSCMGRTASYIMLMYANVCKVKSNATAAMDGSDSVREYVNVRKCMHSAATWWWPWTGRSASESVLLYANVCKSLRSVPPWPWTCRTGSESMLMYANVCRVCRNVVVTMLHSTQTASESMLMYANVCKCMHSVQQRGGGHEQVGQHQRIC